MKKKADPNLANQYGKTALYEAIQVENVDLIDLLLKQGAVIHDISALYFFIEKFLADEWEDQVKNSLKIIPILEKLYAKMLSLSEEEKFYDFEKNVKTYLDKLNHLLSEVPEMVWESMTAFPLENGRVPLDVSNLCLTYLGFFSDKYQTETKVKQTNTFSC